MGIDRDHLEQELLITSGEYFSNSPAIIAVAIDHAIMEYSSFCVNEKITSITTIPNQLVYPLPQDFKSVIDVYRDTQLYNALYNFGYIDLGVAATSNVMSSTYYLDILIDKMEFYRLVAAQARYVDYSIDDSEQTFTLISSSVPDPYSDPKTYIIHYSSYPDPDTIPEYHYEYIYKLASSILMAKQALAMSKTNQVSGPGLSTSFTSPQVLMTLAKDLKTEVLNSLSHYLPERG